MIGARTNTISASGATPSATSWARMFESRIPVAPASSPCFLLAASCARSFSSSSSSRLLRNASSSARPRFSSSVVIRPSAKSHPNMAAPPARREARGASTIVSGRTMKKPVGLLGGFEIRVADPLAERRTRLAERMPYLAAVLAPSEPQREAGPDGMLEVATYNVHRFAGPGAGNKWVPEMASEVISELQADVIALQEVLRPFEEADPLPKLADELGLYLAFVSTRVHRKGELGNAILSRWPLTSVFALDLSFSRLEQRSAIAAQFARDESRVSVVATHLALVDRTRQRQVHELLDHPQLQGPTVLLGDMNAWRRCPATRPLEDELTQLHHHTAWPPTWPAARPVLALDRVYARGARVARVRSHKTTAARRASDHLPVVATVELASLPVTGFEAH